MTRSIQGYSEKIDAALRLAATAHAGQVRKGTVIPYLMHPTQVALILDRHGYSEVTVLAGILHDVLEDGEFGAMVWQQPLRETFPELRDAPTDEAAFRAAVRAMMLAEFGEDTLRTIDSVTELKRNGEGDIPWRVRKKAQLEHVAAMTPDQIAVKAADATHNARSILRDVSTTGLKALERFSCSPAETLWYYGSVSELVTDRLGKDHALARELGTAVDALVQQVDALLAEEAVCGFCGQASVVGCCSALLLDGSGLRVRASDGRAIYSLSHWARLAPPRGKERQWVDGRSAKEVARAWSQLQAPEDVLAVVRSHPMLAEFEPATAYAEFETKLDDRGQGRIHDLLLLGRASGKRVLVGIEAKSDEELGPVIGEYLARVQAQDELRRQAEGTRLSQVPERIQDLARIVFGDAAPTELVSLRYQLLHGLAGTLLEARRRGAEVAVFLVHEFLSGLTDPSRVERNEGDVEKFIRALGSQSHQLGPTALSGPFSGAKLFTDTPTPPYFIGVVRTTLPGATERADGRSV